MALATLPTQTVTVSVTSVNLSAVTVSPTLLTFTADDWNQPQTVTATPLDDPDARDEPVLVTMAGSGGEYQDVIASVQVNVDDDETAALTVSVSSLSLVEGGATGEFTVALTSPPTSTVSVRVESSDTEAVTVSPSPLTFTADDWNTAQTVTVTAVHDPDAVDESVTVGLRAGSGEYEGITGSVAVSVDDDDTTGLELSTTTVSVTEGGATGSFTVALSTQPTAEVTVSLRSDDTTSVTVSPTSLTFDADTWDTAQTVTVTAIQDDDAVDESVSVALSANGGDYERVTGSVTVSVTDDDTPALEVSQDSLRVDEGDRTGESFTVALATAPTATVMVSVTSADADAVAVSPTALIFTTTNWATPQSVTVTGVSDLDAVDESVTVTLSASGGDYESVTSSVTVTVDDDDTAAIVVSVSSLDLVEGGPTGSFTVALATLPTETVTVAVASADTGAVTVDTRSLTFDATNWETAQTVTVTTVGDPDAGNESVAVSLRASGGEYDNVTNSVTVNVDDDETAALTVAPTTLSVDEGDTTGDTFTVVLATPPTVEVTVSLTSEDAEAVAVTPATVTFDADNYNTPQTVTVTAVDDADAGDETVQVNVTAAGGEYSDVSGAVTVTVNDDETPALTVSKATVSLTEGGADGSFTVTLATPPTETVTVTVTSADVGAVAIAAGSSQLTFDADTWNTPQTVTVSGVQDDDATDESVTVTATAAGGEYAAVTAAVTVTVDDDETVDLELSADTVALTEGGADGSFTVALTSEPTAEVTVTVTSTDTGAVTVAAASSSLTFDADTWNTPQSVTVTPVDDADARDESVSVSLTASGGDYATVTGAVTVTVDDDETAALTLSPTTLSVDEGDTTGDTFTVVLATPPTVEVTVTVTSADADAVTASPATLTFDADNYNTPQTVTVKAVDDADATDENVTVTASADGGEYNDVTSSVTVAVNEDETVGLSLSPDSLRIVENGADGSFTVALTSAPTAEVTVTVTSGDTTTATVSPAELKFTAQDYATPKPVTVSPVDDSVAGDRTATVTMAASGGDYEAVSGTVTVTVGDDDAALTVSPEALTVTEGDATGETFTVRLAALPSGTVTVTLTVDNTTVASVNPTTLTFTKRQLRRSANGDRHRPRQHHSR